MAFDIDNVSGADVRRGRDADRVTVTELAEIDDRQPVHLADAAPVGVDQQRIALDGVDDPRLQAVEAMPMQLRGFDHVGQADDR